jgi:hypothetical protein
MHTTNALRTSDYAFDKHALKSDEIETYKKSFADEGYFVIRNVISQEKLANLHRNIVEEFDRAKQSGALFSGGGLMSGHLNCFPGAGSRFIYETLEERGIIALIKELNPGVTRLPNVGCNFNLPHSVTQHYHTDQDFTKEFMIVNIAVVDTVVENGAIDVIPGTHKKYYPFWRFALEGVSRNSIRVPMKQGDILVRTSNVWEDPFMVEGGKITFRPNWFKPTRLGRIRERMFVKVPISYSAFRFVRSLYGNKGY